MKILLQRVSQASVSVAGTVIGRIGPGLLAFVCGESGDTDETIAFMAHKTAALRIFQDANGKMNRSARDIGAGALVVSQFTLAARWRKGNRPGFTDAAPPDEGERLYEAFAAALSAEGVPVETGKFGAEMAVTLVNDGPVTIWMDSNDPR